MDIYDPGLLGAAGRIHGSSTPTETNSNEQAKTELDQNVDKLVGNISNWWSGLAKKSQDSINLARQEMQNRGGIVNYAKSEYAKLETSIGEAQKKARDQSQSAPKPEDASSQISESECASGRSEISKGKQRAIDGEDLPSSADGENASNPNPTLGTSVSSLFSKLTSDPRLVQLQNSLTSTLQSVSSPQGQRRKEGDGAEKATGPTPINIQESLSKLSLTIQSHLPHLDLKESQQLATRYLSATESFAREIQSDMKEFVGELVRIVPPEGEGAAPVLPTAAGADSKRQGAGALEQATTKSPSLSASGRNRTGEAASVSAKDAAVLIAPAVVQATTEDEEDFAWDEDDEEAAAASNEAVPVGSTKTESLLIATATAAATVPDAFTTIAAAPGAAETKPSPSKSDDSEDDSDWE